MTIAIPSPGTRYYIGLAICAGITLYGLWMVHIARREEHIVAWLRPLWPSLRAQQWLGGSMALPLAFYLWLGRENSFL